MCRLTSGMGVSRWAVVALLGWLGCAGADSEPAACADRARCGAGQWSSVLRYTPQGAQEPIVALRVLQLPEAGQAGSLRLSISQGTDTSTDAQWTLVRDPELATGALELPTNPDATVKLWVSEIRLSTPVGEMRENCTNSRFCGRVSLSVGVDDPADEVRLLVAQLVELEGAVWDQEGSAASAAPWLDGLSTARVVFNRDGSSVE